MEKTGETPDGCGVARAERMRVAQRQFLEHLARSGNVSEAARVAGVDRSTFYGWRDADAVFASGWEAAIEEAVDLLEAEARRRAVQGYDEPVVSGGRVICDQNGAPITRRKYSDGLLSFLLRAHRPGRFKDADQSERVISITISPDDREL